MPKTMHAGVALHYERHGDAGDPLLLVMGLGGSLDFWEFQTPVLARHHRVCVYDNRGIGHSDKPAGPYDVRTLADDAVAILDACGFDRAHVVGLSMGGMIAQDLAIRHSDRVGALVLAAIYARPDEDAQKLGEMLKQNGNKNVEIVIYPESSHGFHADYRPSYNKADAEDGWKRCTGWFEKYLKG